MDVAYNQHSDRARRKNRSTTNINHLSLAPLTVKLPINDGDEIPDSLVSQTHATYLQGKSAPTTPRLLSRGSVTPRSRSHHRTPSAPDGPLSKSKSSTYLGATGNGKKSRSGASTPRRRRDAALGNGNENESDWLLRAGALLSSEAREYKGQAWLVSRQSSTSIAGMRDADEEAFEQELAREREVASHRASRRGSSAMADDDATPNGSRFNSRFNSRKHSMAETRSHLGTPFERPAEGDSYFPSPDGGIAGPDFVNLDEKLEELERDTTQDDEATVRRLVRHGTAGKGSWISNVIGWSLFKVDEHDEESEDEEEEDDDYLDDEELARTGRGSGSHRHFEGVLHAPMERLPPPTSNEGGWKDAAWLLSVASKVMF